MTKTRTAGSAVVWLLVAALLAHCVHAFYLPGVAPKEYRNGEAVALKVNKMVSSVTQIPFDYYSLPFCREDGGPKPFAESLGEILMGDKIESSPYEVPFPPFRPPLCCGSDVIVLKKKKKKNDGDVQILSGVSEVCKVLCTKELKTQEVSLLEERIRQEYRVNW